MDVGERLKSKLKIFLVCAVVVANTLYAKLDLNNQRSCVYFLIIFIQLAVYCEDLTNTQDTSPAQNQSQLTHPVPLYARKSQTSSRLPDVSLPQLDSSDSVDFQVNTGKIYAHIDPTCESRALWLTCRPQKKECKFLSSDHATFGEYLCKL